MLSIEFLKTKPNKANTIDKRAIINLRSYVQYELSKQKAQINLDDLIDECNYIIVEVEGYENIAFCDYNSKCICEVVQPIDRENNKLYPIQKIELKAQYKRF